MCLLLLGIIPSISHALEQPSITVDGRRSCSSCVARSSTVITIGSATDSVLLQPGVRISPIDTGGFLVAIPEAGVIASYASDGRFVSAIGRRGEGPGEFQRPLAIAAGANGSQVVLDNLLTVRLLDRRFMETARVQLRRPVAYARLKTLPDGRFAHLAWLTLSPVGGDVGFSLVTVDPVARSQDSHDVLRVRRGSECSRLCSGRLLSPDHGSTIWISNTSTIAMEEWSTEGRLLRTVRVSDPSWFTSWNTDVPAAEARRDETSIASFWYESEREIWLVATVPRSQRSADTSESVNAGSGRRVIPVDVNRLGQLGTPGFDSIVALLDLSAGTLTVVQRVPEARVELVGPGLGFYLQEDDLGYIRANVVQFNLVRGFRP